MKYLLLFIYRLLNIIVSIIGSIIIAIMIIIYPVWLLFGYLFKGADYLFDTDGEEYLEAVWNAIHYPLDIFYDFIDDMDDNDMDDTEFNLNNFGNNNFWNNNFWK